MTKPSTLKSLRTLKIKYNLPINRTLKFWKGLEKGKIYTTKCKKCKKLNFPPVIDCGVCGSSEVEWIELSGEGKILTYTQIFAKPASFSQEPPYITIIAKLKEGVKVLAWLTGVRIDEVRVGKKVKLVSKVTADGRAIYEFVSD